MNEQKNKTGYPHIDRPWMQFYDPEKLVATPPEVNMTEYLKMVSSGWMDKTASTYYGKKTSYQELFTNADIAAKVLSELGIKKGDIGINLVPNIPEAGEIWLGATQMGAVSDYIDPRPDSMNIEANAKKVLETIKYEQAKYLVALDKCYLGMLRPIEHELKELGIEKIIILNASDSMNLVGKIDYLNDVLKYNELKNIRNSNSTVQKLKGYQVLLAKLKAMKSEETMLKEAIKESPLEILNYSELKKDCVNGRFTQVNDVDLPNYIGHTSGTSGSRPKPIVITNRNSISTLDQLIKADIAFDVGDRALRVLPLFAPFGAYDNYLLNFVSGANNIEVPEFEINEFGYLLKKYHPNVIMATPAWLAALPDCKYLEKEDLSCIKTVIYGGDAMTAKDEEKVNIWLKNHGSNAEVEKGHGMSEFCGCGTYAQKEYNKPESIGIPLPDTIYSIVDPNIEDKLVPLKFEEGMERLSGELVVSSDAVTEGILHGDIIIPHFEMDGKSYIRTRDLVEMDRDGIFYHNARKDRSFVRFDGYKYKPHEVEKVIEENPNVKYARVVPYFEEKKRGIMPICHLVLNDNVTPEDIMKIIEEIVYKQIIGNPEMSSRQIPSKFKIRANMPLSKNGKVDVNVLINEGLDGTEINVDVEETNLTVEHINIYKNSDNMTLKLKK